MVETLAGQSVESGETESLKVLKLRNQVESFGVPITWIASPYVQPRKDAKMGAPVQPVQPKKKGWFQCCMGAPRFDASILLDYIILARNHCAILYAAAWELYHLV